MMDTIELLRAFASVIALLVAIIGHEIMHGWVAYRFGDTTAKAAGRLSINPIRHIDPIGSILVPGMLFLANAPFLLGWARPVPVDSAQVIRNGGYPAAMQVSLAGIAYNLAAAAIASILFLALDTPLTNDSLSYIFLYMLLYSLVIINVVLAVFNLWPLPQFDGAHFISYLGLQMGSSAIARFYASVNHYGMLIVIAILMIEPLREFMFAPVRWLMQLLLT